MAHILWPATSYMYFKRPIQMPRDFYIRWQATREQGRCFHLLLVVVRNQTKILPLLHKRRLVLKDMAKY